MSLPSNRELSILCLYAGSQTYTATVFEHVDAFRKYSAHKWYFLDYTHFSLPNYAISCFDAVVVHYSVRLPFGQLPAQSLLKLAAFQGLKVLFIQDEYDHTNLAREIMRQAGFQLVFTVVPEKSIPLVYPAAEFPGVRFVSNLTGYVPDDLHKDIEVIIPASQRQRVIAYRGRPLPMRYGRLGQEKVLIGKRVKEYCSVKGISHDIAWSEEARIYGQAWYRFVSSSKAMLGSESGSNVFDWNGDLQTRVDRYIRQYPRACEAEIYDAVIAPLELDGVMNQISPRVFEMISAHTLMVLFEGEYSGVLVPYRHYLPLKKDFGNIDDVFEQLKDGERVDEITANAYKDIVASGVYGYPSFVREFDRHLDSMFLSADVRRADYRVHFQYESMTFPVRANPPLPHFLTGSSCSKLKLALAKALISIWGRVPITLRPAIKKIFGRV